MSIQAPDIEMGSSGAQLVNLEAAAPHVSDAAADGKVNVELHGSGDDSKDSAIQTSDALGSGDKGLKLGTAEHVAIPTELAARAATLGSRWNWLNWTCATPQLMRFQRPASASSRPHVTVLPIT